MVLDLDPFFSVRIQDPDPHQNEMYPKHWIMDKGPNCLLSLISFLFRLLPAFNTTTGLPYPRVNLKTGLKVINKSEDLPFKGLSLYFLSRDCRCIPFQGTVVVFPFKGLSLYSLSRDCCCIPFSRDCCCIPFQGTVVVFPFKGLLLYSLSRNCCCIPYQGTVVVFPLKGLSS